MNTWREVLVDVLVDIVPRPRVPLCLFRVCTKLMGYFPPPYFFSGRVARLDGMKKKEKEENERGRNASEDEDDGKDDER